MIDKAAIFHAITKRNALRRTHGLPPLDVAAEYRHEVLIAKQREHQARCDAHADDREAIRQEVLAELRAQHGASFGLSIGGRWAVGLLTRKRFEALMEMKYGARMEGPRWPRNAIIYGASTPDT